MQKQKVVYYIDYQKTNKANFLKDVKNYYFSLRTDDPSDNYGFLINTFTEIVNELAPLEKKFRKDCTKENKKLYKKQRNKCVAYRRKCVEENFNTITDNKTFGNKKL